MRREKSLVNAIARAKRNIDKYSPVENILDSIYEYSLRIDEIEILVESVNKFAKKNFYDQVELEEVLRNL